MCSRVAHSIYRSSRNCCFFRDLKPLSTFHFSPRRRRQSSKAGDEERSASWAFELVNCCSELERKHLHAALESFSATKDPTNDSTPVSHSQLRLVFLASATPFIGFGFLDNFIMIVAGEYVDLTLATVFGFSTMAVSCWYRKSNIGSMRLGVSSGSTRC
ncbi:unnamed protein product [Taenia asiatica]|uniref:Transmembrane protein 65 n=1 Tax=Taenia asiatica TaxID=60517 RepID=A0A0R3W6L7_TAEAS|nr:unnamed protein product [Taenia asiatica]